MVLRRTDAIDLPTTPRHCRRFGDLALQRLHEGLALAFIQPLADLHLQHRHRLVRSAVGHAKCIEAAIGARQHEEIHCPAHFTLANAFGHCRIQVGRGVHGPSLLQCDAVASMRGLQVARRVVVADLGKRRGRDDTSGQNEAECGQTNGQHGHA